MRYMVERLRMLMAWRRHADLIASAVRRVLPGAEVYVVGGATEERLTAVSDIDILVVTETAPRTAMKRAEIIARNREEMKRLGIQNSYPYEIHLVGQAEAQEIPRKVWKYENNIEAGSSIH